jgi:hypothetical protein
MVGLGYWRSLKGCLGTRGENVDVTVRGKLVAKEGSVAELHTTIEESKGIAWSRRICPDGARVWTGRLSDKLKNEYIFLLEDGYEITESCIPSPGCLHLRRLILHTNE